MKKVKFLTIVDDKESLTGGIWTGVVESIIKRFGRTDWYCGWQSKSFNEKRWSV
jgi:hypothetical protein